MEPPASPFGCQVSKFMVSCNCRTSPSLSAKGVNNMGSILNFALSVAAGVLSYYICKWLDDQFRPGKH